MFCYQCEQTAGGKGCTKIGVCGKQPDVAALQDLLVYALRGLSQIALEGRKVGVNDPGVGAFVCKALFSTLTNVNFDAGRIAELTRRAVALRDALKGQVKGQAGRDLSTPQATFTLEGSIEALVAQGEKLGPLQAMDGDEDIRSLKHIVLFGVKGVCGLCGPRGDPRPDGRRRLQVHRRGPRRDRQDGHPSGRLGGTRHEDRRDEHPGHGAARRGEYGDLRPSRSHEGASRRKERQGHPHFRS